MSAQDPFHHVRDSASFELPRFVMEIVGHDALTLPKIFGLQITKYMVLQVVAGLLALVIFRGLAARIRDGQPARGKWWNFWELLALFIRDEVVRPAVGVPHDDHGHGDGHAAHHSVYEHPAAVAAGAHAAPVDVTHPADKFLPFVWTIFFYTLFCNLLGAIPFLGSPTADTSTTGILAIAVFAAVVIAGVQRSGFAGFLKSIAPSMELPGIMGMIIIPLVWVIEAIGLLIKHFVLAVRLYANMLAGHTVLGVILGFIAVSADQPYGLWYLVTPASVIGQVLIGLLELFVAFLQAYVFAFLASLFIGAAVNPH
ncbi:F0F1 ATP synthase subunit A [Planctellipticum variicoloris]|uniref:F0F1 ATP synthase subunit A n=1 Tax=Planctellipticum variicoloris TaxID=3064265 RepID=UPI003013EC1F|nr:F0F1 ATP synthase subunit A [Planctomycetaceae bacterium SH412]